MAFHKHSGLTGFNRFSKQLRHPKLHYLDILGIFCFNYGDKNGVRHNLPSAILHRKKDQISPDGKPNKITEHAIRCKI